MPFLTDYARGKATDAVREAVEEGRSRWQSIFTDKERGLKRPVDEFPSVRDNHNSWVRGSQSTGAAYTRLLQAMRSMAPGGWSDDRFEQGAGRHFRNVPYICIHRTGEILSEAEVLVFRKDDNAQDGKRPISRNSDPEAYRLVKVLEEPNNDDALGDMLYSLNQQLDLTGTALTWMVPNRDGRVAEMYVIPTAIAIPQPAINPDYPDGYYRIQPVYPYGPFSSYPTPASAVGAPIPAQWMLRMKYPHPYLRYDGWSPLTALQLHLDEIEMMDRSRHYAMRRGINPSAVLQFRDMEGMQPLPEAEIQRIVAQFENELQGPENTGRLYVAPPGSELEQFGTSPKDMDYQAGWDQLTTFAMAGFGISKPAAGMVETSSYATLFATLKQLHLQTLEPKCRRIESKWTRQLAPFYGDDLIVELRCKRIDDHEILFSKIDKLSALKGMPASFIKMVMRMLDLHIDEQMVEELAAAGQEGMMGQAPGMPGGVPGMGVPGTEQPGSAPPVPPIPGKEAPPPPPLGSVEGDEKVREDKEVTESRPTPAGLGRGALGPRKSLNGRFKSLANGHVKSLSVETLLRGRLKRRDRQ